jgi:hypothetical protein
MTLIKKSTSGNRQYFSEIIRILNKRRRKSDDCANTNKQIIKISLNQINQSTKSPKFENKVKNNLSEKN